MLPDNRSGLDRPLGAVGLDMAGTARTRAGAGSRWILGSGQLRHPVALVCLPHAGGAASAYRSWLAPLSDQVDVLSVQLPGRETQIDVPFATDMAKLVAELVEDLAARDLADIALFGHSMGAVIATKLCVALEQAGRQVRHLVVSGHPGRPPRSEDPRLKVGFSPDDRALLDSLEALDSAAGERFALAEFRELFLPVLRADMRLLMSATWGDERVDAPITALAGVDDPLLPDHDLSQWDRISSTDCATYWLPGDHFYLADPPQAQELARIVGDRLGTGGRR